MASRIHRLPRLTDLRVTMYGETNTDVLLAVIGQVSRTCPDLQSAQWRTKASTARVAPTQVIACNLVHGSWVAGLSVSR